MISRLIKIGRIAALLAALAGCARTCNDKRSDEVGESYAALSEPGKFTDIKPSPDELASLVDSYYGNSDTARTKERIVKAVVETYIEMKKNSVSHEDVANVLGQLNYYSEQEATPEEMRAALFVLLPAVRDYGFENVKTMIGQLNSACEATTGGINSVAEFSTAAALLFDNSHNLKCAFSDVSALMDSMKNRTISQNAKATKYAENSIRLMKHTKSYNMSLSELTRLLGCMSSTSRDVSIEDVVNDVIVIVDEYKRRDCDMDKFCKELGNMKYGLSEVVKLILKKDEKDVENKSAAEKTAEQLAVPLAADVGKVYTYKLVTLSEFNAESAAYKDKRIAVVAIPLAQSLDEGIYTLKLGDDKEMADCFARNTAPSAGFARNTIELLINSTAPNKPKIRVFGISVDGTISIESIEVGNNKYDFQVK